MSATRNGMINTDVIPQPDFSAVIAEDGKTTATQTFAFLKGQWSAVSDKFEKGTPLGTLDPNAEGDFADILLLNAIQTKVQRGGYVYCSVSFVGYYETDATFSGSRRYSRNTTLIEKSILEHPLFLSETAGGDKGYSAFLSGAATVREEDGALIVMDIATQITVSIMTDPVHQKWLNWMRAGLKTFQEPVSEWTVSKTSAATLASSDISRLGKKDTPGGNPYTRDGYSWVMVGATEEITQGDLNTVSITWREEVITSLPWAEIFD